MRKVFVFLFALFCAQNGFSLIIYRPENSKNINDLRCYIKIENENGEDISEKIPAWFEFVSEKGKFSRFKKKPYLLGGMAAHVFLGTGKFKISVYTTKEDAEGFSLPEKIKKEWTSDFFELRSDNPLNVIFVNPVSDENGFYNGKWHIDYRAPRFYLFTKPYRS